MNQVFSVTRSALSQTNQYTLTLTAKEGYKINDGQEESMISIIFTSDISLAVTSKSVSELDSAQFVTSSSMIGFEVGEINAVTHGIIRQVFLGTEISNDSLVDIQKKFTVTKNNVSSNPEKYTLTLRTKEGYRFEDGSKILTSNEFFALTVLGITVKQNPEGVTVDELKQMISHT